MLLKIILFLFRSLNVANRKFKIIYAVCIRFLLVSAGLEVRFLILGVHQNSKRSFVKSGHLRV